MSFSQGRCGSSIGTIENSETLALVVGLAIMFILVIYARLVTLHLTMHECGGGGKIGFAVYHKLSNLTFDA